jgi:hypothetical protein
VFYPAARSSVHPATTTTMGLRPVPPAVSDSSPWRTSATSPVTLALGTPPVWRISATTVVARALGAPPVLRISATTVVTRLSAISGHRLDADLHGVHGGPGPRPGGIGVLLEHIVVIEIARGQRARGAVGRRGVGPDPGPDRPGRGVILARAPGNLHGVHRLGRERQVLRVEHIEIGSGIGCDVAGVAVVIVDLGEVAAGAERRPIGIRGVGIGQERADPALPEPALSSST